MTEQRRRIKLTEAQIEFLWTNYPDDPELIEFHCRDALYSVHVPNATGRWPRYDVRVYRDDGFMGSGYLLVHWDDSSKVPDCLDNGYCPALFKHADEIVWDDQPERDRLQEIRDTLESWACPR